MVPSVEVPTVMRHLIGERADGLLPPAYGGSAAPFPPPGEGLTAEEKVGALLANTWRQLGFGLDDEPTSTSQGASNKDNEAMFNFACCFGFQSRARVGNARRRSGANT